MPISRLRARTLAACAALAVPLAVPVAAEADIRTLGGGTCSCHDLAIAVDGAMYLAEGNARQVHKLDAAGNRIATWRSGGGLNLVYPLSLAALPSGRVVISDANGGNHLVSSTGEFLGEMPGGGGSSFAVLPDDTYYQLTWGTNVLRVAPDGATSTWDAGQQSQAIAYSSLNEHLYLLNADEGTVSEKATNGAHVRTFGEFGNGPGQLNAPHDITVGADGSVYVAQANTSGTNAAVTIKKFSADGVYLGELPRQVQPGAIVARGDGLYVLEWSPTNGVTRIDLRLPIAALSASSRGVSTSQQATFDASGSSMPFGTVTRYEWDLDGNGSFETDTGATATAARRFTAEGTQTVSVRVTGSTGATDVASVAVSVGRSRAQLTTPGKALTGQPVRLDASGSSLGASEVTDVRWDLDGDGSFETAGGTSLTTSRSWSAVGTHAVGVRVERSGGVVDTASASVEVLPAPPGGPVGVTINDAARYTNDPNVTLSVVWPALAANVLISNDGGFRAPASRALVHQIEWRLDSSGPERLPKTVYIRFDGATQTYTDDIILDQTAPIVQSALATALTGGAAQASAAAAKSKGKKGKRRGKKRGTGAKRAKAYRVRVKATDRTSGVAKLQLAVDKRKPAKAVAYRATLTVRGAKPRFVRAVDRAGNVSRWKALR